MPTYQTVEIMAGGHKFHALVLNELTAEGYQMYCPAGWMRRTQEWLDKNTVPTDDDAHVEGLIGELRGRGIQLVKEVPNG